MHMNSMHTDILCMLSVGFPSDVLFIAWKIDNSYYEDYITKLKRTLKKINVHIILLGFSEPSKWCMDKGRIRVHTQTIGWL